MVASVEAVREVEIRYVYFYLINSSIQSKVNIAISAALFVTTTEKLTRMIIYVDADTTVEG